jgi:hypothetical protein
VLRHDSRAAGIAADVAASISPYTDQLAHDPKLRRRLTDVGVQDAKRRIDRRRNRRTRVIIGLVGLGAIAALAVPVVRRATNETAGDAFGTTAGAEAV